MSLDSARICLCSQCIRDRSLGPAQRRLRWHSVCSYPGGALDTTASDVIAAIDIGKTSLITEAGNHDNLLVQKTDKADNKGIN